MDAQRDASGDAAAVVVDFAAYKAARETRGRIAIEPRPARPRPPLPTPREVAHRQQMLAHLSGTSGTGTSGARTDLTPPVSLVFR